MALWREGFRVGGCETAQVWAVPHENHKSTIIMNPLSRPLLVTLASLLIGAAPLAAIEPGAVANRPAQVVQTVAPNYPYFMRRAEATGEVTVSFKVNAQGIVTHAKVVGTTNREFVSPSLQATRQWTFKPAMKDGRAVEARVQQTRGKASHHLSHSPLQVPPT